MKVTIYSVSGTVLHEGEAEGLKQYIERLVKTGANLSEADLSGLTCSEDLSWVDLSGADLARAVLAGADLSGTTLGGQAEDEGKE